MNRTTSILIAGSLLTLVACTDAPTTPSPAPDWARVSILKANAAPPNCNLEISSDRFSHPVFPWLRTSESVFLASGSLFIEPNGPVDDGFAMSCTLRTPWEIEVTGRIVSGGQNYVFPGVQAQFSNGEWFKVTSLPDGSHGWLIMTCNPESWLAAHIVPGHTLPEICNADRWNPGGPASVAEGEYMTLRITADGSYLRLYAQTSPSAAFQLAHEVAYVTTGLTVQRFGVSQPWDSHVELTGLRAH